MRASWSGMMAGCATLALMTGCPEPEPEVKLGKEGEACQVAKDCEQGLTCRAQVCTPLNVGDMDMTPGDMTDGDMGPDAGGDMSIEPVNEETYLVGFLRQRKTGEEKDQTYMYTVNTGDLSVVRASDDPSLCQYNCWLSSDATTLVYLRPTAAQTVSFDVYAATLDANREVSGQGTVLVEGAQRVSFTGDAVSFSREEKAYYLELGTTNEVEIATLESNSNTTQDSWSINLESNRSVVFSPTLNKLAIRLGELGTSVGEGDGIYVIDSSNYQMTSGAYFGSSIPSAISPDGRYLAVLTDAPNNYGICDTNAECDAAAGQHCGESGICTVREITIHTFDLQNLSELPNGSEQPGKLCNRDSDCSSAHECYIPADTQLDKARCIPRRIALGLQASLQQPRVTDPGTSAKTGCELTASEELKRYTTINPPLSFDRDNMLYVTAERNCLGPIPSERNMPDTDILAINPAGGAVKIVAGNNKQDFDASLCYNEVDQEIDITNCVVYIAQAVLSPGGNEFAVLATHPDLQDPQLVPTKLDVWTILKDGSKREWIGEGSKFDEVRRVSTHEVK